MVERTIESWWNGVNGSMGRRRVRLREDPELESTERFAVEVDGPGDRWSLYPELNEEQARTMLASRLADPMWQGHGWKRMDQVG